MSEELEFVWANPRDPEFDLNEFVSTTLDRAKEDLKTDGYLVSRAMIVTPDEIHCYGIGFEGYDEKVAVYGRLITIAKELNAEAIVSVNDAYSKTPKPEDREEHLRNYVWGQLANDHDTECIFLTVTGPNLPNRMVTVPYKRNGEIQFGPHEDKTGGDIALMDGWASPSLKVQ